MRPLRLLAADKMGLHVLRLQVRGVVHIAADVQVIVVLSGNSGLFNQSTVFGDFDFVGEHIVDFFNVFRAQLVLVLAFGIFPVGEALMNRICPRNASGLLLFATSTQAGMPVP